MKFPQLTVCLVALVIVNPASGIIWRVITTPVGWFRKVVVDDPLRLGANARYTIGGKRVAVNSTVGGTPRPSTLSNNPDEKQSLLATWSNIMAPKVVFENGSTYDNVTSDRSSGAINLDNILGPGGEISELAAAKLESFLDPVLKQVKKLREEDSEDSIETILVEKFGNMKDGEHVYDGNNLILSIPPTSGEGVDGGQVKVAYVDLSELKPLLKTRVLTVFTGLGNLPIHLSVPFGFPSRPLKGSETPDESNDDKKKVEETPATDYTQAHEPVPESANTEPPHSIVRHSDVNSKETEPAVLDSTSKPTEAVHHSISTISEDSKAVWPKIVKVPQTFSDKLANAAGVENPDQIPQIMTIYSTGAVVNRFTKIVNAQPEELTKEKKPLMLNPVNLDLNLSDLPHPVYEPEPLRPTDKKYNAVFPRVGNHSEPLPSLASTLQLKATADEQLRQAIVEHIKSGLEGYLFHLKKYHDENNCISLMVCEIGTNPKIYGHNGVKVAELFRLSEFHESNTASRWYKQVARLGEVQQCRKSFHQCPLNSEQLNQLGRGLMFDVIVQK